ncbi:hypothetical protein PspLS_10653 [Pyricularia sp. CBS 133598]|nr:hypothetical protein PspLS_10653 [Pyricularia sp. CBS 133598]
MHDHNVNNSGALSTPQSSNVDGHLTVGTWSNMDIDDASSLSPLGPNTEQSADYIAPGSPHQDAAAQEFSSSPINLAASSGNLGVPELEAYESSDVPDPDEEDLFDTSGSLYEDDDEEMFELEHVANLQRMVNPSVPAIVFTPPSPKRTSPRSPVASGEKSVDGRNSLDPDWVCREKLDGSLEKDRLEEKRRRERKRRGAVVSEKELRRQINELEMTLEDVTEEKRQLKQKAYRQERQLRQLKTTPLAKQAFQTLADVAAMEKKALARTQAVADLTVPQDQYLDLIIPMHQISPRQSSRSFRIKTANSIAVRESAGEERVGKQIAHSSAVREDDLKLMPYQPVQGTGARLNTPDKALQLEVKLEQNVRGRSLLKAELDAVNSRFKAFLSGEKLASKMLPHVLEKLEEERSQRINLSTENVLLRGTVSRLLRGSADKSTVALTGGRPDTTDETL